MPSVPPEAPSLLQALLDPAGPTFWALAMAVGIAAILEVRDCLASRDAPGEFEDSTPLDVGDRDNDGMSPETDWGHATWDRFEEGHRSLRHLHRITREYQGD